MSDPSEPFCHGAAVLENVFTEGARPSMRWLQMQVRKPGFPSYKVGGFRRYRISEVIEWLSKNCAVQKAGFTPPSKRL
jgi:hypothetical protein